MLTSLEPKRPQAEARRELWQLCRTFIRENELSCAETIHQVDSVVINSLDFIEKICEIVGFHEPDDQKGDNEDAGD